ncbi:MAG TPA: hypothetical protein VEC99_18760 [Clostridia bacterium]|nr:hypothetical protein [Clostridia bacterium]
MRKLVILFCFSAVLIVLVGASTVGWQVRALPMVWLQFRSWVRQSGTHENLYEVVLRPRAAWVKDFYMQNQRLPTQEELNGAASSSDPVIVVIYTNTPQGDPPWPHPGRDFMLCVPAGDWSLYLQSWDGKEFKYWTD